MTSLYRTRQGQVPGAVHPPVPARRHQGRAMALEDEGGTGEGGAGNQAGAIEDRNVAPSAADPATAGAEGDGPRRLRIGAGRLVLGAGGGDGADRFQLDRPPLGRVAVDLPVAGVEGGLDRAFAGRE